MGVVCKNRCGLMPDGEPFSKVCDYDHLLPTYCSWVCVSVIKHLTNRPTNGTTYLKVRNFDDHVIESSTAANNAW